MSDTIRDLAAKLCEEYRREFSAPHLADADGFTKDGFDTRSEPDRAYLALRDALAKPLPSDGGEFGVPWEPTENMLNAGIEAGIRAFSEAAAEIQIKDARPGITRAVWQAMLAATGKAYIPPPARGKETKEE